FYPLTENSHHQGVLRYSQTPYTHSSLNERAQDIAKQLLDALNYIGVLAIEFFICNNMLYVNEMAPRVHNSGHWTLDGAVTSQFENHLRAITGLPLGACDA